MVRHIFDGLPRDMSFDMPAKLFSFRLNFLPKIFPNISAVQSKIFPTGHVTQILIYPLPSGECVFLADHMTDRQMITILGSK